MSRSIILVKWSGACFHMLCVFLEAGNVEEQVLVTVPVRCKRTTEAYVASTVFTPLDKSETTVLVVSHDCTSFVMVMYRRRRPRTLDATYVFRNGRLFGRPQFLEPSFDCTHIVQTKDVVVKPNTTNIIFNFESFIVVLLVVDFFTAPTALKDQNTSPVSVYIHYTTKNIK